jgi:hypothetical protein
VSSKWRFICFLHSIVRDLNGPIVSAGSTIWVKPPVVAQEGTTPETGIFQAQALQHRPEADTQRAIWTSNKFVSEGVHGPVPLVAQLKIAELESAHVHRRY